MLLYRRTGAVCLALLLAHVHAASGQGSATAGIRGTVTDSAGAPVPAVSVEIVHRGTGASGGALTDRDGRYRIMGLAPGGPHTVRFTRIGFADAVRDSIVLQGGATLRLDARLHTTATELAGLRIDVEREPVLRAARTGAGTLLGERIVQATPLLTRNAAELAVLAPLVTIDDRAISIAGQGHLFNSVQIDGMLSQDLFGVSPSGVPGGAAYAKPLPIDAVQQYQVLVAPFDVRQSGFSGGVLNALTRSGTNDWRLAASGFYRDAAFGGSAAEEDAAAARTGDFATRLLALTAGGPLRRDRTHLFVAAELEHRRRPTPGFSVGTADPLRTGLVPDSVAALVALLRTQYAVEPGEAGRYRLENPLANLFVRVDHRIGRDHRMVARYNLIDAQDDAPPRRTTTGVYELESNAQHLASRTHGASLQLVSRLGRATTAEAMLNFTRTRERTSAGAAFPQVEVVVRGDYAGGQMQRAVRSGAAAGAQRNERDQDVAQLELAITRDFGRHLVTAGIDVQRLGIRQLYVPAAAGAWRFDSLSHLAANAPATYERTLLLDGTGAVAFSYVQAGAFVQHEWTPHERLTLNAGVRVDRPGMPADPVRNAVVDSAFSAYGAALPDSRLLFSPRVAFGWRRGSAHRTQLRGGVGIFTGRPPVQLIANALAHTGLRDALLVCTGDLAPGLDPAAPPPETCADGSVRLQRQVVFFDGDVRWPQDARASLALDQELPGDVVLSVEGVYTHALEQLELRDLNLQEVEDIEAYPGYTPGYGSRPVFGVPVLPSGHAPRRVLPGYGHVLEITNGARNSAFGVSAELQRRFGDRLVLQAGYAFQGSYDTRSLGYADAVENFGATALRRDPNAPELTWSDYHRPHKVSASVWARVSPLGEGTELTATYLGQSGRSYSYVYASDINVDGFPGAGAQADLWNDLVYVPAGSTDDVPMSLASAGSWLGLVELDPCLRAWRGHMLGRNACRAPWSNRIDVRVVQGVTVGGRTVRLYADVMNLLNLLHDDWGLVQDVEPRVPVLAFSHREVEPVNVPGEQQLYYVGPRRRDARTGAVAPALPWTPAYPESHWRAQVGLRIEL